MASLAAEVCVTAYVVDDVCGESARQLGAAAPEGRALKTDVRRGRAVRSTRSGCVRRRLSSGNAPRPTVGTLRAQIGTDSWPAARRRRFGRGLPSKSAI